MQDETMPRWSTVLPCLREFQGWLTPHVPELTIRNVNVFDCTRASYLEKCKNGIFDQKGVYLLFDPEAKLQYVGVAMTSFHDRIWSHDDYVKRWWTDVIVFPDNCCFLAPALELLLISRLNPEGNTQHRKLSIPK